MPAIKKTKFRLDAYPVLEKVYKSVGGYYIPKNISKLLCSKLECNEEKICKWWNNHYYITERKFPEKKLSQTDMNNVLSYIETKLSSSTFEKSGAKTSLRTEKSGAKGKDEKSKLPLKFKIVIPSQKQENTKPQEIAQIQEISMPQEIVQKQEISMPQEIVQYPITVQSLDEQVIKLFSAEAQIKINSIPEKLQINQNAGFGRCQLCMPIHPNRLHQVNDMHLCGPCARIIVRKCMNFD